MKLFRFVRSGRLCNVALRACYAIPLAFGSSAGIAQQEENRAMEGFSPAQQFEIVDCLLPGQVRMLGARTYITPRRPDRTTVKECRARGGEFKLYDRTDHAASLNIWLPQADSGDPEAQTYVGMLYERGINAAPDYQAAAGWYEKAARQGHADAQYSLGTMYERGLGVETDLTVAFDWYRKAQGIKRGDLVYKSAMVAALREQRREMEEILRRSEEEIAVLRQQVENLKKDDTASQSQLLTLENIVARMAAEREKTQDGYDRLPPEQPATEPPASLTEVQKRRWAGRDFGRFFALVIGVADYQPFSKLTTALNDAQRAERVLRDDYGFSVTRLDNPGMIRVLDEINSYFYKLKPEDNLLIYFAGYGERLPEERPEGGYWLPTDADALPNTTNWIANQDFTDYLKMNKARRILVVSDSIYAGLLENSLGLSSYGDKVSDVYLKAAFPKRSRMLLASGTKQPVPTSDGRQSRFARAFLDVLDDNDTILHVPLLFQRIKEILDKDARESDPEPQFRIIKPARHAQGDFFFVPLSS